ncbi:MAG: hypothetical protein NZ879_05205 [Archaeoglobaceae archaeon]|nr:hypothetical protein [Archaeoglobaceae archaeon]MDW8118364.1 hypothetical protein [Archaeoglobaceae archaeon]
MMWLFLSILTIFAYPGDNVTITITEPSLLETSDPCMFFVENMNSSAYLPAGSHTLKIGAKCLPGIKFVTANKLRIAEITVSSEINEQKLMDYAYWLERKLIKINSDILTLREELKNVTQKLNETKTEKDKIEMEKKMLEFELIRLNESYNSLKLRFDLLSEESENKTSKIAQMEIELKSLAEQSTTYRIATFFLVSIFIGSFTAMVIMTRRS